MENLNSFVVQFGQVVARLGLVDQVGGGRRDIAVRGRLLCLRQHFLGGFLQERGADVRQRVLLQNGQLLAAELVGARLIRLLI